MSLMPDCREVSAMLSDRLDRNLGGMERARLRVHLMMCKACARVEGQLEFLRRALSRLPGSSRDDEGGRG
jgi:predicted anti-sigma-YlaC factor YlaD